LTRGRAATPDPFDLSAVGGSDELFDALSARRPSSTDDPAAALLAALVADVDTDAPPLPAPPARVPCGGIQGQYRRGVRAFVSFGVAALVLTSAGAAAAGGGGEDLGAMGGTHGSAGTGGAERSNENAQRHDPVGDPVGDRAATTVTGDRTPVRRPADKRPVSPSSSAMPADDQPWSHWTHRSSRGHQRSPLRAHRTDEHPSGGRFDPPSPTPEP
jgi:hypothetical protein